MSKSSRPPAVGTVQCYARLLNSDGGVPAGKRCPREAVGTRNGRPVCWLHKGATRSLTFVDAPVDSTSKR